jgi:hypothetical protein
MKRIVLEIDEQFARDLAKVAPGGPQARAGFVRLALRSALDLALDAHAEAAYRAQPLCSELSSDDLAGWDEQNKLARAATREKRARCASKRRGA